jgi:hypothetical protein
LREILIEILELRNRDMKKLRPKLQRKQKLKLLLQLLRRNELGFFLTNYLNSFHLIV